MNAFKIYTARGGRKLSNGEYLVQCPSHEDKNPSCTVRDSSDGKILVKCHAGCDNRNVINGFKALNMWPEKPSQTQQTKITVEIYQDYQGNDIRKVVRKDFPDGTKSFSQYGLENGQWVPRISKNEVAPLFYKEWKESPYVFLVEGEKCARRLKELNFKATPIPGGAQGWKKHYAKAFGGKLVSIFPDNDEPGRKFAQNAFDDISEVAKSVRIIELPNLGPKEDIYDWLAHGN